MNLEKAFKWPYFRFIFLFVILLMIISIQFVNPNTKEDTNQIQEDLNISLKENDKNKTYEENNVESLKVAADEEEEEIVIEKEKTVDYGGLTVNILNFVDEEPNEQDVVVTEELNDEYNYRLRITNVYLGQEKNSELLIKSLNELDFDLVMVSYKKYASDIISEISRFSKFDSGFDNNAHYFDYQNEIYGMFSNQYLASGLFYNKSMIEEADLVDPLLLYNQGLWDLDTFYSYLKKTTKDLNQDGTNDVYGLVIHDDLTEHLAASHGVEIVTVEDEKVNFNITDPKLQEILGLINSIYQEDLKGGMSMQGFLEERACFYNDNAEAYVTIKGVLEKENIGFVPYPSNNVENATIPSSVKVTLANENINADEDKIEILKLISKSQMTPYEYYMQIFEKEDIANVCVSMTRNVYLNPIYCYENLYTLYLDMLRDIKVGFDPIETVNKYNNSREMVLESINS